MPSDGPQFCCLMRVSTGFCSARVAAYLPTCMRLFWSLLLFAMQFCPAPSPTQQSTFGWPASLPASLSVLCSLFSVLDVCAPATAGAQIPGGDTGSLPVGEVCACQSLSLCRAMQFCQQGGIEFPFVCHNAFLDHTKLLTVRIHGRGPQHTSHPSPQWRAMLPLRPGSTQCLLISNLDGSALSLRNFAMQAAHLVGHRPSACCRLSDGAMQACNLGSQLAYGLSPEGNFYVWYADWQMVGQPRLLRPNGLLGLRIGEASHPGPSQPTQTTLRSFWGPDDSTAEAPSQLSEGGDILHVAIANPTAILGKFAEILELQAHVVAMAETSAVCSTQDSLTPRLRAKGFRCHWSAPVQPHATSPGLTESRRGCPGGTAVLSQVPSHYPFQSVPTELWETQRYVDSVVRIGTLAIRVASVYGYPSNHPDALVKNQALFSMVLLRLAPSKMPFLVCGDFNCDVTSLPCWQGYLASHCHELHQLHRQCTQAPLPATCKGATHYDTAILCPIMTRLWQSSSVDVDSHMFDAHSPVHLWFRLPVSRPATQAWRLPVSWSSFAPPKERVEHFYMALSSQQLGSGFCQVG